MTEEAVISSDPEAWTDVTQDDPVPADEQDDGIGDGALRDPAEDEGGQ